MKHRRLSDEDEARFKTEYWSYRLFIGYLQRTEASIRRNGDQLFPLVIDCSGCEVSESRETRIRSGRLLIRDQDWSADWFLRWLMSLINQSSWLIGLFCVFGLSKVVFSLDEHVTDRFICAGFCVCFWKLFIFLYLNLTLYFGSYLFLRLSQKHLRVFSFSFYVFWFHYSLHSCFFFWLFSSSIFRPLPQFNLHIYRLTLHNSLFRKGDDATK